MQFKLTTHELQFAVIAFINERYTSNKHTILRDDPDTMDRLIELFGEANRKCKPENNYTVTITIE